MSPLRMGDDDGYGIRIDESRILSDDDFLAVVAPGNALNWPEYWSKTGSESSTLWIEMFEYL